MRILRQLKAEAALLVALADIGGAWPVERVTQALTELADTTLGIAIGFLLREAARRGHLAPQKWETDVKLTAHMPPAHFVILSPAEAVRRSAVIKTFGPPAHSYGYGPYTILVWPENLLPKMASASATARH